MDTFVCFRIADGGHLGPEYQADLNNLSSKIDKLIIRQLISQPENSEGTVSHLSVIVERNASSLL